MDYETRCNNCMTYFVNDNGLETLMDQQGEQYKGCPRCETDQYLIELELAEV